MELRVLYFGALRDQLGLDEESVQLPEPCRVGEVIDQLEACHAQLAAWRDRLLIAVNLEYADRDAQVTGGDELALMPPVQGG